MSSGRVFVTGMGAVSPHGSGVGALWRGLLSGERSFRPITVFDASPYRNQMAGEVAGIDFADGEPRAAAFLKAAVEEALGMAGAKEADLSAGGLVLGTNFGAAQAGGEALRAGKENPAATDLSRAALGDGLRALRGIFPCRGPVAVLSLACASGVAAAGQALFWIRRGRAGMVLAAGYDELSEHCYAGLSALRAITRDTIRPFDKNRSGTLFSEGAGALLLESEDSVRSRGAEPLAEILGYAINNDAFHMTAPDKTGAGIAAVMRAALRDAGLDPADVDHINCHGTGTKYNDMIETRAIRQVFGPHAGKLVLTANKGSLGHCQGAAGALESIATIQALREGIVPPTAGLEEADPDLDLDYCPGVAREVKVGVAQSNSYGLGGTNAVALFAHPDAEWKERRHE